MAEAQASSFRWFVRGDIDGFFGLAVDNLVQLLVIVGLCRSVLGFEDALLFGRVLPGAAVSLLETRGGGLTVEIDFDAKRDTVNGCKPDIGR